MIACPDVSGPIGSLPDHRCNRQSTLESKFISRPPPLLGKVGDHVSLCHVTDVHLTTCFNRRMATSPAPLNVLGLALQCCCNTPKTGFYRDGYCRTGPMDVGSHTVCAVVTAEFLEYSRSLGNDLITPMPMYQFPGLQPGDKWCLCVSRWKQAYDAGCAPGVVLEASHAKALDVVTMAQLQQHAVAR